MKLLMVFFLLLFSLTNCYAAENSATASANPSKSEQEAESCVATAKGPIASNPEEQASTQKTSSRHHMAPLMAKVGKAAPDFEANAFQNGKFTTMKLSDYKGRWVALCFYPGDFTFV